MSLNMRNMCDKFQSAFSRLGVQYTIGESNKKKETNDYQLVRVI